MYPEAFSYRFLIISFYQQHCFLSVCLWFIFSCACFTHPRLIAAIAHFTFPTSIYTSHSINWRYTHYFHIFPFMATAQSFSPIDFFGGYTIPFDRDIYGECRPKCIVLLVTAIKMSLFRYCTDWERFYQFTQKQKSWKLSVFVDENSFIAWFL